MPSWIEKVSGRFFPHLFVLPLFTFSDPAMSSANHAAQLSALRRNMIETLEKWNAELVAEKISLLAEAEASTIEIQRLKAENQTLRLKLETLGPNDDISNSDTANPLQPTEEANSHDVEQVRESESRQAVKVEKEGEPEINLGEPVRFPLFFCIHGSEYLVKAVVTKRPRSSGPQDADGERRGRPSKRRALRVEVFVPSLQDVRAMASREDRASASKSNDTNNPHTDLVWVSSYSLL